LSPAQPKSAFPHDGSSPNAAQCLNPGETLKPTGNRSKGPLAETDIYSYAIINEAGVETGSVEHTDHISINGLKRSQHVVQKDSAGNVIVEVRW